MALATPKRMRLVSPSHARAKVQEKETAKRIGGKLVKGSGSGDEKGDVRLRGFVRVESKTTDKRSFSVTPEILAKLEMAVFGSGEIPLLQVELEGGKRKLLVMPDWGLELITEALRSRA